MSLESLHDTHQRQFVAGRAVTHSACTIFPPAWNDSSSNLRQNLHRQSVFHARTLIVC